MSSNKNEIRNSKLIYWSLSVQYEHFLCNCTGLFTELLTKLFDRLSSYNLDDIISYNLYVDSGSGLAVAPEKTFLFRLFPSQLHRRVSFRIRTEKYYYNKSEKMKKEVKNIQEYFRLLYTLFISK